MVFYPLGNVNLLVLPNGLGNLIALFQKMHSGTHSTPAAVVSLMSILPSLHTTATSYLKIIFSPKLGVGPFFQVLDILEYACGLKLGPALILTKNLYFEMPCSKKMYYRPGQLSALLGNAIWAMNIRSLSVFVIS